MLKKISVITSLLLFSQITYAADISFLDLFKRSKGFVKISGALGGDAIATTTEGDELNAGDAFTFAYGRDLRYSNRSKRFFRISAGVKYGFLKADNDTASISAIPVNALYMQQNAKFVYGGGITTHLNAKVDLPAGSQTESLSIGLTGQAAYRFSKSREIGITIDIIEYDSVSANATGLYFTQRFGVK